MPRQNRVTPWGAIIATPARGAFMGNRGCIHNADQHIVRVYNRSYTGWVTCLLEFKGRKRPLMQPGRYTELFFLDEATAFAAGHRPCGECRRDDYAEFMRCWRIGNSAIHGTDLTRTDIDAILHRERIDPATAQQITYSAELDSLPDGVFVALDGRMPDAAWLVRGNRLYEWSPAGYTRHIPRSGGEVTVFTPRSIVAAFAAGYVPMAAIGE